MNCFINHDDMKEVSVVKYVNPAEFMLDVLPEDIDLIKEVDASDEFGELLKGYFRNRERDIIDGRTCAIGETVAVHLNSSWRPAICIDFNIVKGLCMYEVLLMDSGQIIEVDMFQFRPLPFAPNMTCRFSSFLLLDILPIGMKRGLCGWDADAEEDVRLLTQLASKVLMVVKARFQCPGYDRLFGNIYLQISHQLIDLQKHLVDNGWAFKNSSMFERVYQLSDEHFCDGQKEYPSEKENHISPDRNIRILSSVEPKEITDDTLDNHLPKNWRKGGGDPLSQVDRESVRRRIIGEARIGFGVAVQGYKRMQEENKLIQKMKECPGNIGGIRENRKYTNFECNEGNSSFSGESSQEDDNQSRETMTEDSVEFSETEQGTPRTRNTSRDQQSLPEKTWLLRNEMHKKFGGENFRFKQPVTGPFLSCPVTATTKSSFPVETSQEMRNKILSSESQIGASCSSISNSLHTDDNLQIKEMTRSSNSESPTDRQKERRESTGKATFTSTQNVGVDLSDETRKKVLALLKTGSSPL